MGISHFPQDGRTLEDLVRVADEHAGELHPEVEVVKQ